MKLIALDDGHGIKTAGKESPKIPELNGRIIKENEFNRAVVAFLDKELKRCGFNTVIVAPTDYDTPLEQRVKLARDLKADAYIAIHYNAFDGIFNEKDPEGQSIHIFPGSSQSKRLATCIHNHLTQGTKQVDRGIIESNFYVLRESKMPAILSENGFMDNKREALMMIDIDFQKEVAREHAKGICDYFGVKYIPELSDSKKLSIDMVTKGLAKDAEYWEKVFDKIIVADPAYIKAIMQNAVNKL